jgi:hypothetical protein
MELTKEYFEEHLNEQVGLMFRAIGQMGGSIVKEMGVRFEAQDKRIEARFAEQDRRIDEKFEKMRLEFKEYVGNSIDRLAVDILKPSFESLEGRVANLENDMAVIRRLLSQKGVISFSDDEPGLFRVLG